MHEQGQLAVMSDYSQHDMSICSASVVLVLEQLDYYIEVWSALLVLHLIFEQVIRRPVTPDRSMYFCRWFNSV